MREPVVVAQVEAELRAAPSEPFETEIVSGPSPSTRGSGSGRCRAPRPIEPHLLSNADPRGIRHGRSCCRPWVLRLAKDARQLGRVSRRALLPTATWQPGSRPTWRRSRGFRRPAGKPHLRREAPRGPLGPRVVCRRRSARPALGLHADRSPMRPESPAGHARRRPPDLRPPGHERPTPRHRPGCPIGAAEDAARPASRLHADRARRGPSTPVPGSSAGNEQPGAIVAAVTFPECVFESCRQRDRGAGDAEKSCTPTTRRAGRAGSRLPPRRNVDTN